MNLYPVNLNIHNQLCIVVGGGEVAARKIRSLLVCGADVVVLSPEISPAIQELLKVHDFEWISRPFQKGDLEGAFLVFAATDNKVVQGQIIEEAGTKGILVNVADDPESCSFQVPARVRRGKFLLTVSTGGGSPALAAKIRKDLEGIYGLEYKQFVELLSRIREKVVADGKTSDSHRVLFRKLLHLNIAAQIKKEDWTSLQEELCAILPEDMNVDELIASIHHQQSQKHE